MAFLRNTFENFHHTGAVAPSSPWLARALAAPLANRGDNPIEILEAGPGTGALTVEVLRYMRLGDHLTLCEINESFIVYLREKFESDPRFSPYADQVTLHHGPVEDLKVRDKFDHIVSGLPFNNFHPALVRHIFETFECAIRPGGTVSFFEYAAIRRFKALFSGPAERTRLLEVEGVLEEFIQRHRTDRHFVLFNFPPAWACSLHGFRAGEGAASEPTQIPARDPA